MREHDELGDGSGGGDLANTDLPESSPSGRSVSEILERLRAERAEMADDQRYRSDDPVELDEDAELDLYQPPSAATADPPPPATSTTGDPAAPDAGAQPRQAEQPEWSGAPELAAAVEPAPATDEAAAEDPANDDSAMNDSADEAVPQEPPVDETPPAPADERELPPDPAWRKALRGVGQTLITLGVVVLLFIVYEAFITDIFTARAQDKLNEQLHEEWADSPTADSPTQETNFADVPVGDAFAVLRIPAFGADYAQAVVQGTTNEALEKGPGHYKETAGPGEVGNFAIAGHRVGKGSPFLNLDKLKPGDAIVFETQASWYVYRVIGDKATGEYSDPTYGEIKGQSITTPEHYEVISPVPGQDGATPTQKLLTLTTCHPKFSAAERLIIHAYLDGEPLSKAQYPKPEDVPALKEG